MTVKVLGLRDFREDKDTLLKGLFSCATSGKKNKQRNSAFLCGFVSYYFTLTCVQHTKEYVPGHDGLFTAIPLSERSYLRVGV